jgi:S1-C subfamily serine protease
MKARKNRQHYAYGSILTAMALSFLFLGFHYVSILKEDYTARIISLELEIDELENQLRGELDEKQGQLDTLSSDISITEHKVQELEETSGEYETQLGQLTQQLSDLAVESESFSAVISEVIDSVVSVMTNLGQGSGAIISPDGLVVTNYHVIQGARRASVMTYDGTIYGVTLVGYSVSNDIAVLQVNANETFQEFDFGNSDTLKAGQKVVALGNPAGLSFTATEGIISSPSRLADDGLYYIQTDVTLNPGNSGGPLINSRGELIGIVDWKVAGYEELGFAIPSNRAEDVIEDIINQ